MRELRGLSVVSAAFLIGVLSGCQATHVANSGMNFRQALLEMYTDQAVDNLIRARTGQAFVQLDYKDLLVQVTDQYFGELSSNQQLTNATALNAPQVFLGALTRTFENVFNIHGSAQRQGQMSFHADPITDKNDIYEAYLAFASDRGLFVDSDCAPPKGSYHVLRKDCGRFYWVPTEAAPLFQQLILKTTFMRGPETIPPGYYEVKITKVSEPEKLDPTGKKDIVRSFLDFDKPVPNGKASLVVTLSNKKKVRLDLLDVKKKSTGEEVRDGDPTDRLEVRWSPSRDTVTKEELQGATVRIYSEDHPPEIAKPELAEEIRHDVNRIRASVSPILRAPNQ